MKRFVFVLLSLTAFTFSYLQPDSFPLCLPAVVTFPLQRLFLPIRVRGGLYQLRGRAEESEPLFISALDSDHPDCEVVSWISAV